MKFTLNAHNTSGFVKFALSSVLKLGSLRKAVISEWKLCYHAKLREQTLVFLHDISEIEETKA